MIGLDPRAARTVREIQTWRTLGVTKPRRRVPRQLEPIAIQREYALELLRYTALARDLLAPLFAELPRLLEHAAIERRDAGEGRRVRQLVDTAQARLAAAVKPDDIERLAQKFAERTSTFQRQQLGRQTKAALGADVFIGDRKLAALTDGFIAENVALIRDLPGNLIKDVEGRILRAIQDGKLYGDLAAELDDAFGIGDRRATLIARDQIGKAYGKINAARQREMGIERFVWRTVNDRRVRSAHRAIEGQVFRLDQGHPTEGLPGEPILCRCWAEPVYQDLLDELAALEPAPGEKPRRAPRAKAPAPAGRDALVTVAPARAVKGQPIPPAPKSRKRTRR